VISILKGKLRASFAEILARKGLVVFQFMVSFLLIVAVMVINKQIQFIQNMNLGYNRENVISLTREGQLLTNTPAFLNRIKALPEVKNAAALNGGMAEPNAVSTTSGVFWEGKPADREVNFSVKTMDYDLIETLGMEMAQGRAFSRKFGDEKSSLIFNETAIQTMGLKDPIGKKISMWGEDKIIVGIVKDFLDNSIHEEIRPLIMRFEPTATTSIVVKIAAGKEKAALTAIESIYKEMNPGYSFEYQFIDQQYQSLYAAEQRITVLSQIFAGIAIVISCLGLLGLVSFMAERRAKEIGIRKVLGASIWGIVNLLAKDFLRLVLIAILIASPLAWYGMNRWLEGYAYQVKLNFWIFMVAGVVAVLIAFLTIGFQSVKAALANPVKSLKSE
jgi:ABC-type antimicrobial peptide transport system permease subunit